MSTSISTGPAPVRALEHIVRHMRDRDRQEVYACRFSDDPDDLVKDILAATPLARVQGVAWTADHEPVAHFAAYARTPSTVECALIATAAWPRVVRSMTRWIRTIGLQALESQGVGRAEARALLDHRDSLAWLMGLGAEVECLVPAFGRDGETFVQLALTIPPAEGFENWTRSEPHVLQPPYTRDTAPGAPGSGSHRDGPVGTPAQTEGRSRANGSDGRTRAADPVSKRPARATGRMTTTSKDQYHGAI